jgi:2-C-methyl-D-erythritol 4-phosphate cytidylyltransferase
MERLAPIAEHTVLVIREAQLGRAKETVGHRTDVTVVAGGAKRHESVQKGLAAVPLGLEFIAVHDVARPFADAGLISAGLGLLSEAEGAIPGIQPSDTLKTVDQGDRVLETVDRSSLRAVQTPQVFRSAALRDAHARSGKGVTATDDGTLLEDAGYRVRVFPGSRLNFKITTEFDLALARLLVSAGLVA